MDIYTFAMQMEKDGEGYYRQLEKKCNNQGLKKIFAMLADEEVKHFQVIKQLQDKNSLPKAVGSDVLKNTRNIFEEMRAGKLVFSQGHYVDTTEETNAYRKARDIEEQSRTFYLEKAEVVSDNEAKLLLRMLAAEEDKHCRIMDNIIDFVSRPEPGNWLENAEWHHLEAY
jgi:rubrerythrin